MGNSVLVPISSEVKEKLGPQILNEMITTTVTILTIRMPRNKYAKVELQKSLISLPFDLQLNFICSAEQIVYTVFERYLVIPENSTNKILTGRTCLNSQGKFLSEDVALKL